MASITNFCHPYLIINLIFILTISNIVPTTSCSVQTCRGGDGGGDLEFERWLSWHAQEYHRNKAINKYLASNHQKVEGGENNNGGSNNIDNVLEIAEKNKSRIIVSRDGTGDVKTINEAIARIPNHNMHRVILQIKPGTYWEKIVIPKTKAFVTFEGSANNHGEPAVIIKGNATASSSGKTFNSSTVSINSDYFEATNITFENTAEHVEGVNKSRAAAMRISGTKAAFHNCHFYGQQDTLYDHKGLHYFNHCFIQGSVDFVFGNAKSLYENCTLHSVANKKTALTAQRRSAPSNDTGFSFKNCNVTGSGRAYLGRAWGNYSRVVFSYTFLEQLVLPQGWDNWGRPETQLYYGEYKCSGPGSNTSGRVSWARQLTDEEAIPFLGTYFIYGNTWLNL